MSAAPLPNKSPSLTVGSNGSVFHASSSPAGTTSVCPAKEKIAMEKGADAFVVSKDPESMKAEFGKINLILNTVSAPH